MVKRRLSLTTPDCLRCPVQTLCPLADLSPGTSEKKPPSVSCTRYQAGQYVFTEHQPATGIHVVCNGVASVQSSNEEGTEFGLHLLGTGGFLNVTDALCEEGIYSVSAKVLVDANIAFVRQDEFLRRMADQSVFTLKLLQQVGRQMKQLEERQGQLACSSACERMICLLRSLADLGGKQAFSGVALPATLERSDLASLIGTTPETISRLMSRLHKSGLVQSSMSKIHIPDIHRLKHATCCEP